MAAAVFTTAWPCRCQEQERADARRPQAQRQKPDAYRWRASHGCDADAPRPVGEFEGAAQRRCLRAQVAERQPEAFQLLHLAQHLESGALPEAGGVLDQSAPLMDALEVLAGAIAEGREIVRERETKDPPSGGASRGPKRGRKAPLKPQRLGRR